LLAEHGSEVVSVDIEDRSGDVDLLVDVQAMPEVASGSFACALCTQVLEHLPRPWDALAELSRVLAPGGTLILTVPHLSVMHEAPHDYFRFTEFGLRALCKRAGLDVIAIEATGGIFTFLGHGASGLMMSTLGTLPLLRWPTWLVNYVVLVRLLGLVDRALGMSRLYPCDHLVVARKGGAGANRDG
jgi:SAM-dependent methyltransferase